MRLLRRFFPLLIALSATAQQAPKPPDIPQALITKYFKAHAESADARVQFATAQQQVQQKAEAEQKVAAEIQAVCGEKWQAQLSPNGDPVCVAKPEPKK